MKVIYEIDIVTRLRAAIHAAAVVNKKIKAIELTDAEIEQFKQYAGSTLYCAPPSSDALLWYPIQGGPIGSFCGVPLYREAS